jgi:hypothetical protein
VTNDVWQERRHVEESREEVVGHAKQIYESRHAIVVDVAIHWAQDDVVDDRAVTAMKIAEAVERMVPDKEEGMSQVDDYRLFRLGLPQLFRIGVHRHPIIRRSHWYSPDAGTVRVLGPDRIREVIDKKEQKHRAFLDRAEGWLLLYTFDERVSGSSEIGDEAEKEVYRTRFSKVFALNVASRQLFEFRVMGARS